MTCRRLLLITDWRSQHCSRSLFLLFVAAESSGEGRRWGPRPRRERSHWHIHSGVPVRGRTFSSGGPKSRQHHQKGWRRGSLAVRQPVSKLIFSLGFRPDTHEHSHWGPSRPTTAGIQTYPPGVFGPALTHRPTLGRPKQLRPGFGQFSRHSSPQPHSHPGEGPSSIVSNGRI